MAALAFPALVALFLLAAIVAAAADRDEWHLEYGPAKPVSFTCATHLSALRANIPEYIAFAAIPPDFGHQHPGPSAFFVHGRPFPAQRIAPRSLCHRQVFSARIPVLSPANHTNISVTVSYQITLVGRHLKRGAQSNPPPVLRAEERELALRQNSSLDFKSPDFAAWLDEQGLRRRSDETPITFARRACEFAGHHLQWVWPPQRAKLSVACRFTTGDCGSFSQLFVGIMRGNGIPARSLIGCWVSPGKGPVKSQGHAKSEFWADGVGWVPVDANNLQFGEENPDFLALVVGDETPLVPHPQGGLRAVGLQETYLEAVGGEGPGSKREVRFVCVALEQPKR